MPLRSILWFYYTRVNRDFACCNTCKREISTKGQNTSNLASHLKSHHFSDYQQMQERRKEEYSSEHSQCSDKDFSTNDEHNMFSDDGPIGSGESTEDEKYSQDPVVMVPPTNSRSEMVEISSLLSLTMPMANVNFLVNEGGGKDEAVAIEVRPRERQFRV